MRLALQAENIIEFFLLKTGKISPFPLLPMLGLGMSQALITATQLNLFEALKETSKTPDILAQELKCDRQGIEVLLESLEGFGFLRRKGEHYGLTSESKRWLTGSDTFVRDSLLLGREISKQMVQLEESVRTGEPINFHFCPPSKDCHVNYMTALRGMGQRKAPQIIQWANLDGSPQRLLDVAGGAGEYSVIFCQHYPDLKADILDLPYAARQGEARIEEAGMSDRISYLEGDLFEIEWDKGYDIVLLSNVLHVFKAEKCRILLNKAYDSLGSNGILLINDTYHPGSTGRLTPSLSLFSLIYYVTCGGRSWPYSTYLEWLTQAGFRNLRSLTHRSGLLFLAGRKS